MFYSSLIFESYGYIKGWDFLFLITTIGELDLPNLVVFHWDDFVEVSKVFLHFLFSHETVIAIFTTKSNESVDMIRTCLKIPQFSLIE